MSGSVTWRVEVADALAGLPFDDSTAHTCITSPPYWGLRDYGTAKWLGGSELCPHLRRWHGHVGIGTVCTKCGAILSDKQLGVERTPEEYIEKLVRVFRHVRRVLRDDGTLWVNIGDSYAGSGRGPSNSDEDHSHRNMSRLAGAPVRYQRIPYGLKPKDLVGIPWMLASLQELSRLLQRAIILHGDWRKAVTPNALGFQADGRLPAAVLLDPPYPGFDDMYVQSGEPVHEQAAEWAREHGDDPQLRIALCGYEGDVVMPDTWECVPWKSKGKSANASHERIWFSPHCIEQRQMSLLS